MPTAQKEQTIERLRERLDGAKCLYVTDFTGLDVASMTDLRARLTAARVEYLVVKNTLARRALAEGPFAELAEHMSGPNAFAVSHDDVVTAAKIQKTIRGPMAAEPPDAAPEGSAGSE